MSELYGTKGSHAISTPRLQTMKEKNKISHLERGCKDRRRTLATPPDPPVMAVESPAVEAPSL
jgi:hypothetical protein